MTTYALDETGTLAANKIEAELIDLAQSGLSRYSYVSLSAGPFYADSLVISHTDELGIVRPWVQGDDYTPCFVLTGATGALATNLVYAGIAPANPSAKGTLSVTYQTLGGQWVLNKAVIDYYLLQTHYSPAVSIVELVPAMPVRLVGEAEPVPLSTFANISRAMTELTTLEMVVRVTYVGLRPVASTRITAASIIAALGYTPANAAELDGLEAALETLNGA